MKIGGIAPGNAGQVVGVDLDDRKIIELIRADEPGGEDAAVVERDAHLGGAVDDVVVGEDVAIGRDDDAAADSMLELRLRLHSLAALAKEELAETRREILR